MSNLLLAGFGTVVTMLALAGFSVYQLEKTSAEAHGPRPTEADEQPRSASAASPAA